MSPLDLVTSHPPQLRDLVALVMLFAAWFGIGWFTENPPPGRPSVSVLMTRFRHEWMRQFVTREPRIFDGNILSSLRDGTAFFASACMIATGGLLALIGNAERLRGIAVELEFNPTTETGWELRLLVTMFFIVNAFLKFVWAHRLFGYCAVIMASVPNNANHPEANDRALQAGDLNITAARSFNAGLRSVYFALGSLAWLGGAWALMAGTAIVLWVTWRREFRSTSRQVILRSLPQPVLSDHSAAQMSKPQPPQA
jgi:uncharacterized membrane protein